MFDIRNNGPYFEAVLETMSDKEITQRMHGASRRLSGKPMTDAHRVLLQCVITEGARELRKRWYPSTN